MGKSRVSKGESCFKSWGAQGVCHLFGANSEKQSAFAKCSHSDTRGAPPYLCTPAQNPLFLNFHLKCPSMFLYGAQKESFVTCALKAIFGNHTNGIFQEVWVGGGGGDSHPGTGHLSLTSSPLPTAVQKSPCEVEHPMKEMIQAEGKDLNECSVSLYVFFLSFAVFFFFFVERRNSERWLVRCVKWVVSD